jgi:hypothetical protein
VARASARALLSDNVPLRPAPRPREPSPVLTAVRSTWPSLAVSVAFTAVAGGLAVFGPRPFSVVLVAFCAWQALAWGSALPAAVLSTTVGDSPERGALRESAQNTGERPRPERRRRLLLVPALGLALLVLLIPTVYTAPPEPNFASDPWEHSLPAPDVAIAAAPPAPVASTPANSPAPVRSSPVPAPKPSPSPSTGKNKPSPSPAPTPSKKPKGKPSPTPT